MISEKNTKYTTEKNANNQYSTHFIDYKTGLIVSMIFKNKNLFPSVITFFNNDQFIMGKTTEYNKEADYFNVNWEMDNSREEFLNIPFSKEIYSNINLNDTDPEINHQITTIYISLEVWNAINKYTENKIATTHTRSALGNIGKL